MANNFKFQATQVAEAVQKKLFIKRLPEWMQGLEDIQAVSNDIIQQWFNPAEQEIVDGYIGDRASPAASGKIFIDELTQQRQDYQLSPAYVSHNDDTSLRSIQFYEDLVGYMNHYGSLTNNESRLFDGKFYSWTPPINPNKMLNYSSYVWDTQNEFGVEPDYIVMERGAINGNTWSLQNFWYTRGDVLADGTVLTDELMQDSRFQRAQVSIIEFNKDIEMLNYGSKFRGVVDYLSDTVKPEDLVNKPVSQNIRIDGNLVGAGQRILFTSIGNSGENNRIYKVYIKQMVDGERVYGLSLDEDEESPERPSGEPIVGDVIVVKYGNVYRNTAVYWNGTSWVRAQAKSGINQFPLFQLYDRNGSKLDDAQIYPNSTFSGSSLFGLKINYNYGLDKIYGYHVELADYNYYVYENFLQSQRFEYDRLGVTTEIPGLYYYNINTNDGSVHLKTDWVRSTEYSKQFVRQVPEITKTSMYRVFNTLNDMLNFNEPLENMYAYVIEVDSTYQYYKAENATFMEWHRSASEGIQSDSFNHTYELAQQINPNNPNDVLEVRIGDYETKDYTVNLNSTGFVNSITIGSDVALDEDTVLVIRTYSKEITPNKELGSYEIPINLQNNPYNDSILYVDQSLYTPHFQEIVAKNITTGTIDDFNDYEKRLAAGLVDNSVGTKIIQNEASLLPLMINTANENISLFEAVMFLQNEYFRFVNKFNTKMINLYDEDPSAFNANSASNIVDIIFDSINVGKDSSFPFYADGVASVSGTTRAFVPPTPQFLGILKLFAPQKATYLNAGSNMGCYNISHTGNITKAYRVINGVTKMDDVILELETRIFNSVDNTFKNVDYQPLLSASDLFPTPYNPNTDYNAVEAQQLLLRGYTNFIASNGIDNSTHSYDQSNWMTWNYTGTFYMVDGVQTTYPARGSWRAIYTDQFGTYRPATHPWEMFGFAQRPTWWNQEYEPTTVQVGTELTDVVYVYEAEVLNENGVYVPSGLWDVGTLKGDASTGTILYGAHAGSHQQYKRFGKQPFKIVGTGKFASNGEEICTIDLIAPEVLGLVNAAPSNRAAAWAYGDMGEMEFTYCNTALFAYDQMLQLYRAKPAQFATYFYDTRNSTLKTVRNGLSQFLYGETRKRLNLDKDTLVSGENNARILGYQMAVSNYLVYQNKNITTKYGDILRSSGIQVGHKLGGFTKVDQLSFSAESFGLISQENQHIGLVRSSSFRTEVLSSVNITWTGTAYQIDGYDLVNPVLTYKVPNKNGKKITLEIGQRKVVHYTEYKNETQSVEYGTLMNSFNDVYAFLCGYGEHLKDNGWIFEEVDGSGARQDWTTIAKDFVTWSQTDLNRGDFISVTPSSSNVKFGADFGAVQSVTQNNGGVWSLLDDNSQGIRQYEIETTRIGNVFTVRTLDDVEKRIALVRLSLVSYEHAVVFDDQTIFGDYIYQPTYGSIQELIKMYGYVTGDWTGRLQAPGFIILEAGTLPSFEKLVDDFTHYYDTVDPVSGVELRDLSRHLIGYQTRDYLQRLITNEPGRIDFYKGFIKDKGTNGVLEKVLRVSKSYNTEQYKSMQEWAFKVGTYGNVYGKKNLQFNLINNEFKQEPQLVTFDQNSDSDTVSNEIVYFGSQGEDPRWITRPEGNFSFPMRSGRSDNIQLPDIGPVTLDEVSYSTWNFEYAYADRLQYINNNGKLPESVWMFSDFDSRWNIFDLKPTGATILSITPIVNDDEFAVQYCTVKLNANHGLSNGDYFYFIDNTDYMPDALKVEMQYYNSGTNPDELVIALDLGLTINFTENFPVMYFYSSRFGSETARASYISKKYSVLSPESTLFDRPSTYNSLTNVTETYMNVFDPINGVLPGAAMTDVTFTSPVDPAMYNSNGETLMAWGSEHVGKVWWNTSTAFYLDYTRPIFDSNGDVDYDATIEYKRYNWGRLLPHSKIDVLEWVCSPVEPFNWERYCKEQAKLNKKTSTDVPSGTAIIDSYSQFVEFDESTGEYVTKYYFWVRDTIYTPNVKNRSKSCNEIARIIEDPSVLNVPWFSPINDNSFILSGMQYEVNDDKSILTVSYKENHDDVIKHEQYQLCKEGESYNFNPTIWNSMWNSLIGEETLEDGTTHSLLYPSVDTGLGSNKTWFKDVIEARRNFVDSANEYYQTQNITTNTVVMNDVFNVKTQSENPNEVGFKVLSYNNELVITTAEQKFLENDAVLVSTNGTLPSPLNSTSVYFVHYDENEYIHLMNSPSTGGSAVTITLESRGEGQHKMIKQSDYIESLGTSLDMTQYWSLTDWYDVGFSEDTSYTTEVSLDVANTKSYQEGDVIRINDTDGGWTLYEKTYSRGVAFWNAVGRSNSTVKLNNMLYNDYEVHNEDGSLSNVEINVRRALALLKNSFEFAQSDIVFDMVKYVHTEQTVVDWVFKTSYIYIVGLDQSLKQNYTNSTNLIGQIMDYFEEVKPYRTKIRSQIEQKTTDEDEINGISNDLDPTGYILVDGTWVKTQKDIWDYEYAQFNTVTNRWEIHGSLPSDFVTPNRRFQEIDVIMHYDNVQCTPDSDLYSREILENVNKEFQTNEDDFLGQGSHYKLQRYSYTFPVEDVTSVERLITSEILEKYPSFNATNGLSFGVNEMYTTLIKDVPGTLQFKSDLDEIVSSVYSTESSVQTIEKYSQYNTLSNRLKLYTNMSDSTIGTEVNCPFKGSVYSDNPNTRLPFGFSASNSANSGYITFSREMYNKYVKLTEEAFPDFTSDEVLEYMEYEYGIYAWKTDITSQGRYYSDTIHVLTLMRNLFDKDNIDNYDIARSIVDVNDVDSVAFVLIPRKLVYLVNSAGNTISIPIGVSIDEFMENQFITSGENLLIQEINLDDLPLDVNTPLYSDIKAVMNSITEAQYFNDMNSFDNLALESQTNVINYSGEGLASATEDPIFVDISDLNPSGADVAQIRFTVDGYSYDTPQQDQLKADSRFKVEGLAILNPYKRTEAIVSIPSYAEATQLMDRSKITRQDIQYFNRIREIVNVNGGINFYSHNLKVGDVVMVFTPGAEDYYDEMVDGSFKKVLSVNNIKSGVRPNTYTVSSISGNNVTINGLQFDSTHLVTDPNLYGQGLGTSIQVVRIKSFVDGDFKTSNAIKYSTVRNYSINVMNYEVFYDVQLTGGAYTDTLTHDEYDQWLVSNEIFENQFGDEVDNGYYLPVYGKGVLSELVRTKMTESISIMVYEYDSTAINPVKNASGVWGYSQALTDGVFIASVQPKLTVVKYVPEEITTYVAVPKTVSPYSITNGVISGSATFGEDVMLGYEDVTVRYENNVLRGSNGTAEHYFEKDVTYNFTGINIGDFDKLVEYKEYYIPIPLSTYSTSLSVSGTDVKTLLTQ